MMITSRWRWLNMQWSDRYDDCLTSSVPVPHCNSTRHSLLQPPILSQYSLDGSTSGSDPQHLWCFVYSVHVIVFIKRETAPPPSWEGYSRQESLIFRLLLGLKIFLERGSIFPAQRWLKPLCTWGRIHFVSGVPNLVLKIKTLEKSPVVPRNVLPSRKQWKRIPW